MTQVDPRLVAASVHITNDLGGQISSGSGTIVAVEADRALVLTCRHLFPQTRAGRVTVRLPSGRGFLATLIAVDDRADLAALAIRADTDTPWVPIGSVPASIGEAVWQVGYPHGRGPQQRVGSSNGIRGHVQSGSLVTSFRLSTTSGDSGSGIFRASDSTLIGILWGGSGGETSATGVTEVQRFVEQRCLRWFPRWRNPDVVAGAPTAPSRPAPGVGSPSPPGPFPPRPDLQPVLAELRKLQEQIHELKAMRLQPGSPGKDGEPGAAGRDGKDGVNGKDADTTAIRADIEALRRQVQEIKIITERERTRIEPIK